MTKVEEERRRLGIARKRERRAIRKNYSIKEGTGRVKRRE
jgi:hypothetical protein